MEGQEWADFAHQSKKTQEQAQREAEHSAHEAEHEAEIMALVPVIPYEKENSTGDGEWTVNKTFGGPLGLVKRFAHFVFRDHQIVVQEVAEINQILGPGDTTVIMADMYYVRPGGAAQQGGFQIIGGGEGEKAALLHNSSFHVSTELNSGSGIASADQFFADNLPKNS